MTAIKQSSTNQQNKQIVQNECPVTFTLEKIGGRWKPLILYFLQNGTLRYGQLKKSIPAITEKMLIQHLRELEADQLVSRKAQPVVPPHVEYSLTPSGQTLSPILNAMAVWGLNNQGERSCGSQR
jgi:DNA-binding HxlR family transcriptional regulator